MSRRKKKACVSIMQLKEWTWMGESIVCQKEKKKKMNSHHYVINCNDSKIFLNNTEYSEIIRVAKA